MQLSQYEGNPVWWTARFIDVLRQYAAINRQSVFHLCWYSGLFHNILSTSRSVYQPMSSERIRYKYQLKDYSIQSEHSNLLSTYKSGNMFRLIEPSWGQFINYIEGTFSMVYELAWWAETCCQIFRLIINYLLWDPTLCTSTECTFNMVYESAWWAETCCQIYRLIINYLLWDPTMCTSTECTFSMVCELAWWWLNEPKHVARFVDW